MMLVARRRIPPRIPARTIFLRCKLISPGADVGERSIRDCRPAKREMLPVNGHSTNKNDLG
jgi:hypothetical protein